MLCNLPKTVVVIPCFNEERRLHVDKFKKFADANPDIGLMFVNDGSSDATSQLLKTLCDNENLFYLELPANMGKAEAVRQGMLAALEKKPDMIGFWDADLATPLEQITDFISVMAKQPELLMVTGCRLMRLGTYVQRSHIRHYLGRIFATIISNRLKIPVYDTQCGAKLMRAEAAIAVIQKPFYSKWFFDVEIFKRLIFKYGRETIIKSVLEFPLPQWLETPGSKLKLTSACRQLLIVLFAKP